jgi:2-methylisocitrate lyase-like PEP mutase family enzyme
MLRNAGFKLREILTQSGKVVAPGAYDGISARVVVEAGYPVVYRTGAGTSATMLGEPDLGLITMTEMVQNAGHIASAVDVPVIADADTGYGNALNVIRTVHEFERAGIAGIHIEDQVFPKRCGFLAGKEVIPRDEFATKIKAAVTERHDPNFMIFARTDAGAIEGQDAALDRSKHYLDAGADGIFFHAPESRDELERAAKELTPRAPVIINFPPSKGSTLTIAELQQMGFQIIIIPGICMYAALLAMRDAMASLNRGRRNDTRGPQWDSIGAVDLFKAVGLDAWKELERKYGN